LSEGGRTKDKTALWDVQKPTGGKRTAGGTGTQGGGAGKKKNTGGLPRYEGRTRKKNKGKGNQNLGGQNHVTRGFNLPGNRREKGSGKEKSKNVKKNFQGSQK